MRTLMAALIIILSFYNYLTITSQSVLIWSSQIEGAERRCTYFRSKPNVVLDRELVPWRTSCSWLISVY